MKNEKLSLDRARHYLLETRLRLFTSNIDTVAARKKVGAESCEYVFDVQMNRASKRLKVVLVYPWRANVKTTGGFYCMSFPYFFIDKTAP
jgi:hypothetical protein